MRPKRLENPPIFPRTILSMNMFPNSMEKIRDDSRRDGVDVVIRTKDRPLLLRRALRSVIDQEYENWHIHLINDGGSVETLEALLADFMVQIRSDRLTVVHNPTNLGTSAAANKGARLGHLPFLVIHDDDDSWHPAFLASATSFLLDPENWRFGGFLSKWNQIDEVINGTDVIGVGSTVKGYDGAALDFLDILRRPEIPPIALVLRRNVCERIGYFNENLPVIEDWDLNLRALQIADIALTPEALANHHIRRHDVGHYNNTVTKSLPAHFLYNTIYRNALLRQNLNHNPDNIGIMMGLVRDTEEARRNLSELTIASHQVLLANQQEMMSKIDKLDNDIRAIKDVLEAYIQRG